MIAPAAILAVSGVAQAQSIGYSPGAALDQQSWDEFIVAVTPVPGNQLAFETWKTDAETFRPGPALAAVETSRFQGSVLAEARSRAHLPSGLRSGAVEEELLGIPAPCNLPPAQLPAQFPIPSTKSPPPPTPPSNCIAEEVRRNDASYQHIVKQGLNTQAGLIKAYKAGGEILAFPDGAVELKADWVPVPTLIQWLNNNGKALSVADVKANYFIVTERGVQYAMVAMHLSIKTAEHLDWVWATFEHQWNPGRCDTMGCYDDFGVEASLESIAPRTTADTFYPNCAKSKALAAKFHAAGLSPVWSSYCLKETQVDFVSTQPASKGQPVLDGNSLTERIGAGVPIPQSSCISCHKNASYTVVGSDPSKRAAANKAIADAPIGQVTVQKPYTTYDFVWGLVLIPNMFPPQ